MGWNEKYFGVRGEKFLRKSFETMLKSRVAPDTDLAGYPAAGYPVIFFAGYPVSGRISGQIYTKRKSCLLLVRFPRLFRDIFYRILEAFITLINSAFFLYSIFPGQ